MAWKPKEEMTPEEAREFARMEQERRNMSSTYRCGARTGNRRDLRPAPVKVVVYKGTMDEALMGTACGEV